jgi:hypothetical protein
MAAFVNASDNTPYAVGTSILIVAPSGQTNDDILIAHILVAETSDTIAGLGPPSGWTLISDQYVNTGGVQEHWLTYWYRVAGSGSSAYTWAWTNSLGRSGYITRWNGAYTTGNPFEATGFSTPDTNDGKVAPSINSGYDNSLWIAISYANNWGAWDHQAGFTEHVDGSANVAFNVSSKALTSGGPTGTATFTRTSAGAGNACSLLLLDTTPNPDSDITGTSAPSEASDSGGASGFTINAGTAAQTDADDTATIVGGRESVGTAEPIEAEDASSADGSVGAAVSGTAPVVEDADTSTTSGLVVVQGATTPTEDADTLAATGDAIGIQIPVVDEIDDEVAEDTYADFQPVFIGIMLDAGGVTGTAAATEGEDTAILAGSVGSAITGTIAVTEAADTGSATGTNLVFGTFEATDEADINAASGAVGGAERFGTFDVLEQDDACSAAGIALASGTIIVTEQDDSIYAIGYHGTPPAVSTITVNPILRVGGMMGGAH